MNTLENDVDYKRVHFHLSNNKILTFALKDNGKYHINYQNVRHINVDFNQIFQDLEQRIYALILANDREWFQLFEFINNNLVVKVEKIVWN